MKLKKSSIYYLLIALIAIQDQMTTSPLFGPLYFSFFKYVLLFAILALAILDFSRIRPTTKQLLIFGIVIAFGVYTSTRIDSNVILYIALAAFLLKDKDCNKVVSIIFKITALFFAVNFIMFLIVYLVSPGSLETMPLDSGGVRYLLYYDHPNNAAREYIFIVYMFLYIYYDKMNIRHWIAASLGGVIVYYFTRSDAIWTIFIIFFIWIFRKFRFTERAMRFLVKYGVPLFTGLSFAMIWTAKIPMLQSLFLFLNVLASNRFTSNIRAFDMYGITWLGQPSEFGAEFEYMGRTYGWIYADNMYLYMIIHLGLIYLLILALVLLISSKYLGLRQMFPIVALLIFGTFENRVLSINVYFTVLIAIDAIYNRWKETGIATNDILHSYYGS